MCTHTRHGRGKKFAKEITSCSLSKLHTCPPPFSLSWRMLIQLHYETGEVKNEMEGRAKEEEIKKRKEGKEVFCIRVNRYEANIDDYLCRFALCAPLTSIHRRSHPYDPGRWDNKEPGYPLRVHPVILSKQIRVLLMEIIRGSPWLLEIWISTWERRCSVTLFVLDESSRT